MAIGISYNQFIHYLTTLIRLISNRDRSNFNRNTHGLNNLALAMKSTPNQPIVTYHVIKGMNGDR